jgi:hypothetical protein
MKKSTRRAAGAVAVASVVFVASATSRADGTATSSGTAAPIVIEQTSYSPPNRALIAGGIAGFVGAYVPSVIVAVSNGNSFDRNLYIPVVGPWLDLANRPGCGGGQTSCARESGFAALLIVDGVVQVLGPVATALGFVVPERHRVIVTAKADEVEKPSLHVAPASLGHGAYGVSAFGKF